MEISAPVEVTRAYGHFVTFRTMRGVLLLSVSTANALVRQALSIASSKLINVLHVIPYGCFSFPSEDNETEKRVSISQFMTSVYSTASNQHPELDIRVSLKLAENMTSQFHYHPDVVITDQNTEDLAHRLFGSARDVSVTCLEWNSKGDYNMTQRLGSPLFRVYGNVVLGGTFDQLHTGHKYLLSSALLCCSQKLLIGVSDGPLVQNKTLEELIEPYEIRAKAVVEFAKEVCPDIQCNTVPIYEPLGPTATDGTLECLVVSQETARGGEKVNEVRKTNGLEPLSLQVVGLMTTPKSEEACQKLSSSFLRKQSLGHLRHLQSEDDYVLPWLRPRSVLPGKETDGILVPQTYIVGLTGGIASGKSSIAKRMAAEGAGIVDCDKVRNFMFCLCH
jgi:phosphopantetheine adenylyltransferase